MRCKDEGVNHFHPTEAADGEAPAQLRDKRAGAEDRRRERQKDNGGKYAPQDENQQKREQERVVKQYRRSE